MIRLVANPGEYSGKWIRVVGYVAFDLSDGSLWASEESALNAVLPNVVYIDGGPRPVAPDYRGHVIVEGLYGELTGDGPQYGVIRDIRRFEPWPGDTPKSVSSRPVDYPSPDPSEVGDGSP